MKKRKFSKEVVQLIEAIDAYCMECPVINGEICDTCPIRASVDLVLRVANRGGTQHGK